MDNKFDTNIESQEIGATPAEINNLVTNETTTDEAIPQPDIQPTENIVAQASPQQSPETQQMKHFRQLRDKTERIERERDEALRRLQEFESVKPNVTAEDLEFNVGQDDLVEGKHLSKVDKKIKKLEQQLSQYQKQTTAMTAEAKLKSQFPDFDRVVNQDNIESLKENYPEIAQTLNASTDLYATAVSAYTLIKKLGIISDPSVIENQALVLKNSIKPRPLASVSPQQGDGALSKANAFAHGELSKEVKNQLYKEMLQAMKGA